MPHMNLRSGVYLACQLISLSSCQCKTVKIHLIPIMSCLKECYKVAMEEAAKIVHKNKKRYDRHVNASDLEPGDRVLVRNVHIRGKYKISDKWEPTVHVVVRRAEKSRRTVYFLILALTLVVITEPTDLQRMP